MEMTSSFSSLVLMLLILNSLTLTSCTDQDALLAFKNAITLDPRRVLSNNWSSNASICSWIGVTCGLNHHRVTALNLSGFGLQGTISPHLGNLTFLQSLDISSNNFSGSMPSELFTNMSVLMEIHVRYNKLSGELPSDICSNTPKLKRIYLSDNRFYGKIPKSIYQCTKLEELRFSKNQLNGNIPTEIGNLTMLRFLSISDNNLEGDIPSSIFNISALEYVYLSKNRLSGSIPIFNCLITSLQELYLDFNRLTGGIPKEIGHLTSLKQLKLDNNSLTGHIPKQIGNLTLLNKLHVQCNKLTGELPGELGNLKNMEYIQAYLNDFLSGSIPPSIFNISTLKTLDLNRNQFSGSLPLNMGLSLVNLEELYLHTNRLSGKIPTSITNASMLAKLELSSNSFTGSIPDFGNLRKLQVLRFSNNNLTAAQSPGQELTFLSSLTNCEDLENLELANNPLMNGILPASIGNLSTSLTTFVVPNCGIRGVIPSGLGNLSNLQILDLSINKLEGVIPEAMGELKQVGKLYLYDNQLRGYIPRDLCQMSKLINFYLERNMLTGPIPECFGEIKSLRSVKFASNKLNSTLPSNFLDLPDLFELNLSSNYLSGQLPNEIGRLKVINWLDLSSNKFSGHIPNSIGSCQSLDSLNLSDNMFNGSIPQSIGEAKGLKKLDLSNNYLSGWIPKSLAKLDLDLLNVSCNQLEGEIPDEGCFSKFGAKSFLKNFALCGTERFQVPSCTTSKSFAVIVKYVVPPFIAFMFVMVGIHILIRRWRPPQEKPATAENPSLDLGWIIVSEREIKKGTSSFSKKNLLGRGGMGSVFKATLADETEVAVKIFNLELEGATKSFETESRILSSIRHRNLVKILGCCSNLEFKALILEYMPRGSLEKWLHSDKYCLNLMQRLEIGIDVALALEYLHHYHTYTVVHCDIKPNNVLLDADMTARVGDFGISKLFDNGEAAVHTSNMATIGYAAPELGSEGKVSTSGDVYSFGILLLEMFTSKKPTDDMFNSEMSIKEWVENALQENAIREIVASGLISIEDGHSSLCVTSIFELAMKCLAFSCEKRINMMQVVVDLQKIKADFTVAEIQKTHGKS